MAERVVDAAARSDAELISAVRVGDTGAYEELYRRHKDAALAVGRHLTGSRNDADDVVSEAFARVLSALQRGVGPEMAFRPYLLTSVRNAFYDRTRKDKRLDVTDEVPEDLGRVLAAAAASDDDTERKLAATAFASLPERWQLVLWHTEVEGRSPAEVGPLLGLAPNAVAALAYRAREGLRQAYLNAHIQARPPAECADVVPKLGAYVREDLSNRDRRKVEEHLETCERCQAIVVELQEAGARLRLALIPLIAGIPVAAYLAGIGAGAAGGIVGLGGRTAKRFKDMGVGGQVAAMVGAAAAAGLLVFGAVAFARSMDDADRQQVAVNDEGAPRARDIGSGLDIISPDAADRSEATDTVEMADEDADVGAIDDPSEDEFSEDDSYDDSYDDSFDSSYDEDEDDYGDYYDDYDDSYDDYDEDYDPGYDDEEDPDETDPTVPATTVPPTTAPATTAPPTTVPPTTVPPTTVPPVAAFTVSVGTSGPAYAGLGVSIPVSVSPAGSTSGTLSLGPGRSVHAGLLQQAAAGPTFEMKLPDGVTFASVDDPAWSCSVAGRKLTCLIPDLAGAADSSATIRLSLAADIGNSITLEPTVTDSAGLTAAGTPLVIEVLPPPAGATDVVVDNADLALIGNAVLTCSPAVVVNNCDAARDAPATVPGQADKQFQVMQYIDVDADPATFNSTTATLDLPAGATVLSARLIWGGTVEAGAFGARPPDPKAKGTALITAPGAAAAAVEGKVTPDSSAPDRYVTVADVTAQVAAAGAGPYTVANLQVGTGVNAFGGWALQVVYRDPAAPVRMIVLSDESPTVNRGQPAEIVLGGLPAAAAARGGTLSFMALEGDYGLVPDAAIVDGVPLTDALNPPDNVFNGSIGVPAARTPAYLNNFGFDVDRFPVSVAAGATELKVQLTTVQDRYRLAGVAVVVTL